MSLALKKLVLATTPERVDWGVVTLSEPYYRKWNQSKRAWEVVPHEWTYETPTVVARDEGGFVLRLRLDVVRATLDEAAERWLRKLPASDASRALEELSKSAPPESKQRGRVDLLASFSTVEYDVEVFAGKLGFARYPRAGEARFAETSDARVAQVERYFDVAGERAVGVATLSRGAVAQLSDRKVFFERRAGRVAFYQVDRGEVVVTVSDWRDGSVDRKLFVDALSVVSTKKHPSVTVSLVADSDMGSYLVLRGAIGEAVVRCAVVKEEAAR